MNRKLALGAVVLASTLTLAACGGSEGSGEVPAPAEPPASTATATVPEPTTEETTTEGATTEETTTEGTTTEETTTEEAPGPRAVEVRIENGEPVGGTKTVEVTQGDKVVIRIEVDAPQELHLHGYDIEKEAEPGKPAVFRFAADLEGIFELESHAADATIVKLVVSP